MECPTQPVINKPSWHHEGPRRLDNVFEHWFIRNDVAPGWSAAQGGLGLLFGGGESSHKRAENTEIYLNRKCLMNSEGGPHQAKAGQIHSLNARKKLLLMDIAKMEEYNRRRKLALIDARNKRESSMKRFAKNVGWPLREVPSTGVKDEPQETANPYAPPPKVDEYLAKWEKGPFPSIELNPAMARFSIVPDIHVQITARSWTMVTNVNWSQTLSKHKKFSGRFNVISPITDRNQLRFYLSPCESHDKSQAEHKQPDIPSIMSQLQEEVSKNADWYKALICEAWGKGSVDVRTEIDSEWYRLSPGYIDIEHKFEHLDHGEWSKDISQSEKISSKFQVRPATKTGDIFKFILEPNSESLNLEDEAKRLRDDVKQKAPWFQALFLDVFGVVDPADIRVEVLMNSETHCIEIDGELLEKPPPKWIWKGPEKTVEDPEKQDQWIRETGTLDLLLWKPLSRAWPQFIENIGAKDIEKSIVEGNNLPDPSIPKRAYAHQYQVKDLIDGKVKTIQLKDGRQIQSDVVLTDALTGVPIYQHLPNAVQLPMGHGIEDPVLQLDRKKEKVNKLLELIKQTEDQIERRIIAIKFYDQKCKSGEVPKPYAVNKIIPLAKEIEDFTEQTDSNGQKTRVPPLKMRLDDLRQRVKLEETEIRALEDELAHKAKMKNIDFLPKSVAYNLPLDFLSNLDDAFGNAKTTMKGVTEELSKVTEGVAKAFEFGKTVNQAKDDEDAGLEASRDTYFGRFLVDPATGREDIDVVNRKNSDVIARNRERNRALADVLMSRSDGMLKYQRPTKDQKDSERIERSKAQKVVDELVARVYDDDERGLNLEQWSESERRKASVFGSSCHHDTSEIDDPGYRMKNYVGSIGKWNKQIIVDSHAYTNQFDEFYMSLKPIKNPSEMNQGKTSKPSQPNLKSFNYPPPAGGIPYYTPQNSAETGFTPNSAVGGCYLHKVTNKHDTKFDKNFAAARD